MTNQNKLAIWGITPGCINIIRQILNKEKADVYLSSRLLNEDIPCLFFDKLSDKLKEVFHLYQEHIFIMATGIVVRIIAPLIKDKISDPAVVVIDDKGKFVISLISGHLGGANELAEKTAKIINAIPVITTATDVNELPSIDIIAKKANLFIENPNLIKTVNMAFLNKEKINIIDPYNIFKKIIFSVPEKDKITAGIYISDEIKKHVTPLKNGAENYLILRPKNLVAGIGCNKNTEMQEIMAFLKEVTEKFNLSLNSIKNLASIDIKRNEKGLIQVAEYLKIYVDFYTKDELNQIKNIKNPSDMVKKHIGVKSVCEAAAMLSAKTDNLTVQKQKKGNVTLAIARTAFIL